GLGFPSGRPREPAPARRSKRRAQNDGGSPRGRTPVFVWGSSALAMAGPSRQTLLPLIRAKLGVKKSEEGGGMRRIIGFSCLVAVAVALSGCDVQLQDETAAGFQANPDVAMYPISARIVSAGSMVSQPVFVFAVSGDQRVPLSAGPDGTYQTMLPVKCTRTFPLQFLAIWRLQGVMTKHQLFPPQPREIELTPPPLTRQASIDTSGKPDKK